MSELGDLDLDRPSDASGGTGGGRSRGLAIAGVVLLLAAGAGYYFYAGRDASAPAPVAAEAPAPAESMAPAESAPDLPALGESDALARQLLEGLSSRSELARWLTNTDLIVALTDIIDSIARGQVPRTALAFLAPGGRFPVLQDGGQLRIDPAGYTRYDSFGDLVASLDAAGAVRAYARLRPLLAEAYLMVGRPGKDIDEAVRGALDQVLGVPIIEGDIRVVPSGALYKYADARLEAESGVRRQLLRMGPRNVQLVQAKARDLSDALAAVDAAGR